MTCINPNSKEFKDILAQVGDPLDAEIEYNKQYGASAIKPGVEELFDSNPELANQVYEALGFNDNNFELKENKEAFGKEPHPEGATSYDIFSNGRKIGKIALFEGKNPMIKGLNLNESERNKGLGKALYKWLNYKAILKGGRLYADQEFISPDAQRVWESLNKEGLVDLTGNSPKFNNKQKQQALQLYSQYLNTVFPDSKVKDIVYRNESKKKGSVFNNFRKGKENTNFDTGFYFTTQRGALDWQGWNQIQIDEQELNNEFDNKIFAYVLNTKNPKKESFKQYFENNEEVGFKFFKDDVKKASQENYDSLIATDVKDISNEDQYIVFEPEQIHILGSNQDIEDFKKFMSSSKATTQPAGIADELSVYLSNKLKDTFDYDNPGNSNALSPLDILSSQVIISQKDIDDKKLEC
jgi:hypothetical protein